MPEPLDTIRRVNGDEPMTVSELQRAAVTLDRYTKTGMNAWTRACKARSGRGLAVPVNSGSGRRCGRGG
jgi:hypothetical protein